MIFWTFPYEFYEELYRLRGWAGPEGHKRTRQVARDTNDIVYERLAPGVLDELRKKTHRSHLADVRPGITSGLRLTGHPKLKLHLAGVMALMRAAANWGNFHRSLQRSYPKQHEIVPLALDDD